MKTYQSNYILHRSKNEFALQTAPSSGRKRNHKNTEWVASHSAKYFQPHLKWQAPGRRFRFHQKCDSVFMPNSDVVFQQDWRLDGRWPITIVMAPPLAATWRSSALWCWWKSCGTLHEEAVIHISTIHIFCCLLWLTNVTFNRSLSDQPLTWRWVWGRDNMTGFKMWHKTTKTSGAK